MRAGLTLVGFVVVVLLLATSGLLRGDACVGRVGCIGANAGGIRLHAAP